MNMYNIGLIDFILVILICTGDANNASVDGNNDVSVPRNRFSSIFSSSFLHSEQVKTSNRPKRSLMLLMPFDPSEIADDESEKTDASFRISRKIKCCKPPIRKLQISLPSENVGANEANQKFWRSQDTIGLHNDEGNPKKYSNERRPYVRLIPLKNPGSVLRNSLTLKPFERGDGSGDRDRNIALQALRENPRMRNILGRAKPAQTRTAKTGLGHGRYVCYCQEENCCDRNKEKNAKHWRSEINGERELFNEEKQTGSTYKLAGLPGHVLQSSPEVPAELSVGYGNPFLPVVYDVPTELGIPVAGIVTGKNGRPMGSEVFVGAKGPIFVNRDTQDEDAIKQCSPKDRNNQDGISLVSTIASENDIVGVPQSDLTETTDVYLGNTENTLDDVHLSRTNSIDGIVGSDSLEGNIEDSIKLYGHDARVLTSVLSSIRKDEYNDTETYHYPAASDKTETTSHLNDMTNSYDLLTDYREFSTDINNQTETDRFENLVTPGKQESNINDYSAHEPVEEMFIETENPKNVSLNSGDEINSHIQATNQTKETILSNIKELYTGLGTESINLSGISEHKETLDYSDAQEVTNSYFTSKAYDNETDFEFSRIGFSADDFYVTNNASENDFPSGQAKHETTMYRSSASLRPMEVEETFTTDTESIEMLKKEDLTYAKQDQAENRILGKSRNDGTGKQQLDIDSEEYEVTSLSSPLLDNGFTIPNSEVENRKANNEVSSVNYSYEMMMRDKFPETVTRNDLTEKPTNKDTEFNVEGYNREISAIEKHEEYSVPTRKCMIPIALDKKSDLASVTESEDEKNVSNEDSKLEAGMNISWEDTDFPQEYDDIPKLSAKNYEDETVNEKSYTTTRNTPGFSDQMFAVYDSTYSEIYDVPFESTTERETEEYRKTRIPVRSKIENEILTEIPTITNTNYKYNSDDEDYVSVENQHTSTDQTFQENDGKLGNTLDMQHTTENMLGISENPNNLLPFCDNTLLQNSIKRVINNFVSDKYENSENADSTIQLENETFLSEIQTIPNLKSLFSLSQIEEMIVENVRNLLSRITKLPKKNFAGQWASNVIKNTLRNMIDAVPSTETELPPMTVVEHQYKGGTWTTNLVTLVPTVNEKDYTRTPLEKVEKSIRNLIYHPAVGVDAAKHPIVQNIIVEAVKSIFKPNNTGDNEDTVDSIIRNVFDRVLQQIQETINTETFNRNEHNSEDRLNLKNSLDSSKLDLSLKESLNEAENSESKRRPWSEKSKERTFTKEKDINSETTNKPELEATLTLFTQKSKVQTGSDGKLLNTEELESNLDSIHKDVTMPENEKLENSGYTNLKGVSEVLEETDDLISPIKYYSPKDRVLTYIKSHQSENRDFNDAENDTGLQGIITTTQSTLNEVNNTMETEMNDVSISAFEDNPTKQFARNEDKLTDEPDISYEVFSTSENVQSPSGNDIIYECTTRSTKLFTPTTYKAHESFNFASKSTEVLQSKDYKFELTTPNIKEFLGLFQDTFKPSDPKETQVSEITSKSRELCFRNGENRNHVSTIQSSVQTHEITKVQNGMTRTTPDCELNITSTESPNVSFKRRNQKSDDVNEETTIRNNVKADSSAHKSNTVMQSNAATDSENTNFAYLGRIFLQSSTNDHKDSFDRNKSELLGLQKSDLYYIGDGVKLPLEIRKLKDGSFALSISKRVCEDILKRKCPCCVPLQGDVIGTAKKEGLRERRDNRLTTGNSYRNTKGNGGTTTLEQRLARSIGNRKNRGVTDQAETFSMPVAAFVKRYNLSLELDNEESCNSDAECSRTFEQFNGKQCHSDSSFDESINDVRNKRIHKGTSHCLQTFLTTNDIRENEHGKGVLINKLKTWIESEDSTEDFELSSYENTKGYGYHVNNPMRKTKEKSSRYKYQAASKNNANRKGEVMKAFLNWLKGLFLSSSPVDEANTYIPS